MTTEHDDWTPWSIWQVADLPAMAFERLAQGSVWRIQEPLPDISRYEVDPRRAYNDVVVRVAVYKAVAGPRFGQARILGQWEGDRDWVEVGYIQDE